MRVRCSDPLTVQDLESQYDMITFNIKRVKIAAFETAAIKAKIQNHDSYFTPLRSDKFLQEEHLAGYVIPLTGHRAIKSLEYAHCRELQGILIVGQLLRCVPTRAELLGKCLDSIVSPRIGEFLYSCS